MSLLFFQRFLRHIPYRPYKPLYGSCSINLSPGKARPLSTKKNGARHIFSYILALFASPLVRFIFLGTMVIISSSPAHTQNIKYESPAPIAIMMDAQSGAILFEKDTDRKIPPASMAKMMSVYVAFSVLSKGDIGEQDTVIIDRGTWEKWRGQGSTMFLGVDDKPTVEQLLHGIITLSGNDASVVLAEYIGGTEKQFAQMMTDTAKRIGMENSHFSNATGWPDEGRTLVTGRDLAILARRLIGDFPELYKQYFGLAEYTWGRGRDGKLITQPNRNPLLGKVAGADGLKTGHTEEAGYGFVGSAQRDGRRLITVIAGLDSYNGRSREAVQFMNWGFRAWKNIALFKKGQEVQQARVQLGSEKLVPLVAPHDLYATLPKSEAGDFNIHIRYNGPIVAPITAGQEIAKMVVATKSGEQSFPLIAAKDIGEAGFFDRAIEGFLAYFGFHD